MRRWNRPSTAKTPFFVAHYGKGNEGEDDTDGIEVPPNAAWRRIDDEWLYSAESLALTLNAGINNTSLVLAFELPASKKVLLLRRRRTARQLDLLDQPHVERMATRPSRRATS